MLLVASSLSLSPLYSLLLQTSLILYTTTPLTEYVIVVQWQSNNELGWLAVVIVKVGDSRFLERILLYRGGSAAAASIQWATQARDVNKRRAN